MGFLFQNNSAEGENVDCGRLVLEAQNGDDSVRERLIKSYTPFVLRIASKVTGRYVRLGEDDEVSIGLMAFNEAIDCFDTGKNSSFLTFAETVIKRRLIDYFRKESTVERKVVPLSTFEQGDDERSDGAGYYPEARQSAAEFAEKDLAAERREEIMLLTKKLQEFGISFRDLVAVSPKHEDARRRAMEAAKVIAADRVLTAHLVNKKVLPLKILERKVEISRKTLERQRKYIIAVTLILINDFDHLKQYIIKVF